MDSGNPTLRRKPARHARQRGFTLIQLGVVLSCAAILAAVVLPDFIETQRNKMAVKAAEEVAILFDAVRWFYLSPPQLPVARANGWPGQHDPTNCTMAIGNFDQPRARQELFDNGNYLTNPTDPQANYSNPWIGQYEFDILPSGAGTAGVCMFRISTNVPARVAKAFIANIPQGGCEDGAAWGLPAPVAALKCGAGSPLPDSTRWVRCCGMVPPPTPPTGPNWNNASEPTNKAFCGVGKRIVLVGAGWPKTVTCQ